MRAMVDQRANVGFPTSHASQQPFRFGHSRPPDPSDEWLLCVNCVEKVPHRRVQACLG
jgi:hypothetical protein